MPVSKDEFRAALSRFASGVTVVTTRRKDNQPVGITVSAFASVSLDPPLILVCIDKRASVHDLLVEGAHFAVNILSEQQEHLSRRFASKDQDRFADIKHRAGAFGAPLVEGASASLECRVVGVYPGGDHSIVVGQVESTSLSEHPPLAYYRGDYRRLC
jgi:flavin reductase (DIM6/NTAB) family NADH-FMN oxidoreductase RutF